MKSPNLKPGQECKLVTYETWKKETHISRVNAVIPTNADRKEILDWLADLDKEYEYQGERVELEEISEEQIVDQETDIQRAVIHPSLLADIQLPSVQSLYNLSSQHIRSFDLAMMRLNTYPGLTVLAEGKFLVQVQTLLDSEKIKLLSDSFQSLLQTLKSQGVDVATFTEMVEPTSGLPIFDEED